MNKLLVLFLSILLLACSSIPKQSSLNKESDLNGAYTILYEIVSKQKDLDKISFIKTISPELKPLLQEISQTSQKIVKKLKDWSSQDPQLRLNFHSLPTFEKQIRQEIESDTTRKIISSSKDSLEKLLLLKQSEGLNYQAYLCRWLSQNETNTVRQEKLKKFEKKLANLNRRVFDFLSLNK